MSFLPLSHRKKVAISIVDSITKAQLAISTPEQVRGRQPIVFVLFLSCTLEQVDRLFTFIAALVVKDESEDTRWCLISIF